MRKAAGRPCFLTEALGRCRLGGEAVTNRVMVEEAASPCRSGRKERIDPEQSSATTPRLEPHSGQALTLIGEERSLRSELCRGARGATASGFAGVLELGTALMTRRDEREEVRPERGTRPTPAR
jgi:hypothetical protein